MVESSYTIVPTSTPLLHAHLTYSDSARLSLHCSLFNRNYELLSDCSLAQPSLLGDVITVHGAGGIRRDGSGGKQSIEIALANVPETFQGEVVDLIVFAVYRLESSSSGEIRFWLEKEKAIIHATNFLLDDDSNGIVLASLARHDEGWLVSDLEDDIPEGSMSVSTQDESVSTNEFGNVNAGKGLGDDPQRNRVHVSGPAKTAAAHKAEACSPRPSLQEMWDVERRNFDLFRDHVRNLEHNFFDELRALRQELNHTNVCIADLRQSIAKTIRFAADNGQLNGKSAKVITASIAYSSQLSSPSLAACAPAAEHSSDGNGAENQTDAMSRLPVSTGHHSSSAHHRKSSSALTRSRNEEHHVEYGSAIRNTDDTLPLAQLHSPCAHYREKYHHHDPSGTPQAHVRNEGHLAEDHATPRDICDQSSGNQSADAPRVSNTAMHQLSDAPHGPGQSTGIPQLADALRRPNRNTAMHRLSGAAHSPDTAIRRLSGNHHGPDSATHRLSGTPHGSDTAAHQLSGFSRGLDTATHRLSGAPHGPDTAVHRLSGFSHGLDTATHRLSGAPHGPDTAVHRLSGFSHGLDTATHRLSGAPHGPDTAIHRLSGAPSGPDTAILGLSGAPSDPDAVIRQLSSSSYGPDTAIHRLSGAPSGPNTTIHGLSGSLSGPDAAIRQLSSAPHGPDTATHRLSSSSYGPDAAMHQLSGTPHGPDTAVHRLSGAPSGPNTAIHQLSGAHQRSNTAIHHLSGASHGPDTAMWQSPVVHRGPDTAMWQSPVVLRGPDTAMWQSPVVHRGPNRNAVQHHSRPDVATTVKEHHTVPVSSETTHSSSNQLIELTNVASHASPHSRRSIPREASYHPTVTASHVRHIAQAYPETIHTTEANSTPSCAQHCACCPHNSTSNTTTKSTAHNLSVTRSDARNALTAHCSTALSSTEHIVHSYPSIASRHSSTQPPPAHHQKPVTAINSTTQPSQTANADPPHKSYTPIAPICQTSMQQAATAASARPCPVHFSAPGSFNSQRSGNTTDGGERAVSAAQRPVRSTHQDAAHCTTTPASPALPSLSSQYVVDPPFCHASASSSGSLSDSSTYTMPAPTLHAHTQKIREPTTGGYTDKPSRCNSPARTDDSYVPNRTFRPHLQSVPPTKEPPPPTLMQQTSAFSTADSTKSNARKALPPPNPEVPSTSITKQHMTVDSVALRSTRTSPPQAPSPPPMLAEGRWLSIGPSPGMAGGKSKNPPAVGGPGGTFSGLRIAK